MPPITRDTAWRTNNKVLVQVAQTSAASVRMRSIAAPKPDTEPKLLFPTQGSVATLQPTFRWRAADPKAQGEFVLLVAGQDKPVHLAKAAGGTYRVPAKLLPDTDYSWTVTVAGNELGVGPVPHAVHRGARAGREAQALRQGRVLRSPALHAHAAGDGRDAGSARIVGEARPGAHRPSRAGRVFQVNRLAAAALVAFALAAQAADPVAFVADLKGNATIEGDGKLAFLAELVPGTRLLLGTGASVAVTYAASGDEFTIGGPGEFLVDATEVRVEKGARPARRTVAVLSDPGVVARVSRTATASLRMRGLAPIAAIQGPALEYPVDTRVATLQPLLRWKNDPAVQGAQVSVMVDASGKEVWKGRREARPRSARRSSSRPRRPTDGP